MNADTVSKLVIVGVDGSEFSSAALRYAGTLASRLGARLEVITCITPDYLVVAHLEGSEHPLTGRLEDAADTFPASNITEQDPLVMPHAESSSAG